ncbi:MAG: TolC family protein [Leptospiraceae bacterium]|nr:TolC family protein [Leptospiraceae bacterium]
MKFFSNSLLIIQRYNLSINLILRYLLLTLLLTTNIHSIETNRLKITLQDAESIALANSIIMKTLKDRKEVFKLVVAERWRNYLPRLGVSYFGLKNLNQNQSDSQYNDIRLQLNQLLYDGGENLLEIEIAKLQEVLNGEDWKIAKEKTLLDTRKSYFQLLSLKGRNAFNRKLLERTLSQISDAKAERKTGFSTEREKLEAESKIREMELQVIRSESALLQAEIELKKNMNLPIETWLDLKEILYTDFILYAPKFSEEILGEAVTRKPETKKSKIAIETLKGRKEIAENYWKPKVSVGGYYGQNVNAALPTRNDVYGFNLSVTTNIYGNTNQTATNYGVQTDGTGIQRIPGFGPQFVGRGENAFNSSTLNILDDLSYSRKILEGNIALSEAIRSHQLLETNLKAEILKNQEKVKESWQILRIANTRFYTNYETWKVLASKQSLGFSKRTDYLTSELELAKSVEELSNAISSYIQSTCELANASGTNPEDWKFYVYSKGNGNSLLAKLFPQSTFLQKPTFEEKETLPLTKEELPKKEKEPNPILEEKKPEKKKGAEYEFFLND